MKTTSDINSFVQTHLNEQQRKAVLHKKGSLLIIAGAGSGKTRVITARIAHLIENEQVQASHILALTFTNKAALEMKERIVSFITSGYTPFIGTFHSYCVRFLKSHNDLLQTPFLGILDEDDQHKLLQGIITRAGVSKKTTPKQISYQISQLKNQSCSPDHLLGSHPNPLLAELYNLYEHEKRLSKRLDFDDLLLETVNVLKKNPTLREEIQQKLQHILVDEYQDTNVVQHELLKCLALNEKKKLSIHSLCAVGDEDQSIYSWRGATIANILNFTQDFAPTTIIKIEQNYRSVQPILEVANTVINHNQNRNPKSLWSDKPAQDRIRINVCLSEYQEAELIAQYIKVLQTHKHPLRSIAILYRAHHQSRALEEALMKHTLAYTIIGGIQFYERKEIKDMLAYLRLICNPYDRMSFFRVINTPSRGFGAKAEEVLQHYWNEDPFASFDQIIKKTISADAFAGTKKESIEQFILLFNTLDAQQLPSKALVTILEHTKYFAHLKHTCDAQEAIERIENIKELQEAMLHTESLKSTTITSFLDEVALLQTAMKEDVQNRDTVVMMTLHAAKGLEFAHVIITGIEDGLLPSARSLTSSDSIEEERRLLYVGITRAQERLMLTHARYRYTYGTMTDARPSRFLREIPASLAPIFDCSYWSAAQIYQHMSSWIAPSKILTTAKAAAKKIVEYTGAIKETSWKKNQPVVHATFGVGIVTDIELKGNKKTYLTVKFKSGTKKLSSDFVKVV